MNENEVEKTYDETQDELVQNESLDDEKQSVHQSEEVSDVAIDDDAVKDDLENQQESESLSKNVEQNEEIEDTQEEPIVLRMESSQKNDLSESQETEERQDDGQEEDTPHTEEAMESFLDASPPENRWKIGLVIGVALLCLIGFMIFLVHDTENKHKQQALNAGCEIHFVEEGVSQVEYGSSMTAMDLVESFKGDLKEPKLDTKTVGFQDLSYQVSVGDYTTSFHKSVEIVDTKKPELTVEGESEISLQVGESFTLPEAKATDPVDGDLKVKVFNPVETQTVGKYHVEFSATDKNGNTTKKEILVEVHPEKVQDLHSLEIAEDLTSYESINEHQIQVRGVFVDLEEGVTKKQMREVVRQINLTPQFLLSYVDHVRICTTDTMPKDSNGNPYEALVREENGQRIILLSQNCGEDGQAFLKQAISEMSQDVNIYSKKYKKIIQKEKKKWNDDSQFSDHSFFVETYATYLTDGADVLRETVPETTAYYEEVEL